jgi:hypothetical protein
MKVAIYTVNDRGLGEIQAFLAKYHVYGGDHFAADMLRAWAAQAEFQTSEGNSPTIELRAWESVTGRTQEHEISAAGRDIEMVEID